LKGGAMSLCDRRARAGATCYFSLIYQTKIT
jgi:hypothetical protein